MNKRKVSPGAGDLETLPALPQPPFVITAPAHLSDNQRYWYSRRQIDPIARMREAIERLSK